jgi:hypothetical protein
MDLLNFETNSPAMQILRAERLPFIILAMTGLIAGLISGLARLGWTSLAFPAMINHGGIMVGGFIGTLISLEKIIPLKTRSLYLFPVFSGISVTFFLAGSPVVSAILLIIASSGLSLVFVLYYFQERSRVYGLMLAGAISWTIGNVALAMTGFYPSAMPWWMAFTLLIISAERLELMKFLPVSRNQKIFFTSILATYILSALFPFHSYGRIIGGSALISTAIWLLKFDIISVTINKESLPRFIAINLMSGYIALVFSGIFMVTLGSGAFDYDTVVHSFFLGYVFSMIFAHGPVILPGVIGLSIKPYHPLLYFCTVTLHASWLLRVAGNVAMDPEIRKFSGIVSAMAIVGYFITLVVAAAIESKRARKPANKLAVSPRADESH